jgi:hypothetical protein
LAGEGRYYAANSASQGLPHRVIWETEWVPIA